MLIGTCPTFWAERIGFWEFWILAILGPRVLRALSTFFLNPSYFVGPGYAADGSAAGRTLNPNQAPLPSRPGTKYVAQGTLAAICVFFDCPPVLRCMTKMSRKQLREKLEVLTKVEG